MKFVPNPTALQEIRKQPRFEAGMLREAEQVETLAATFTNRGSDERRGHFADRFDTEVVAGIPRVGNTDKSFYHLIEFGSVNNLPQAPLRRAVKAVGMRLDESPK